MRVPCIGEAPPTGGCGYISIEALFAPFSLKSLKLNNRFVMAPMTRSFSPGGIPTAEVAEYYRKRAAGEVGLILSAGTHFAGT